ncbi:MAG: response regulator transcription factor [Anaerolineae bacterium]|nr:response regulator transcription factor [Anaerolineae bacterium]
MQAIRVLIVDDSAGFRRRVKEFLAPEPDIQIVGEAGDGREAIEKAVELEPDVVLMDVRMAGMSGLDAIRRLAAVRPGVRVIVLSRFDMQEYRDAAQASGASDYVAKRALVDELLPAIRRATGGQPSADGIHHGSDHPVG